MARSSGRCPQAAKQLELPASDLAASLGGLDLRHAKRRAVSGFDVHRWAGRVLVDAAELRRRERLSGGSSTTLAPGDGESD